MWKRVNKSRLCYDGEKVLTLLAPFFIVHKETVNLNKNIQRGSVCPELIACFESRIELKNLHRNKSFFLCLAKVTVLLYRKVVSLCFVWW